MMSDQSQSQASDSGMPSSGYHDWREERRAARRARREDRWQKGVGRPYGWIGGAILILLGVVFLLQNLELTFLTNWWALFILIPAFWAYVACWETYKNIGRLTRGAVGSLMTGILLTILSLVFLLNLTGGLVWPILLITGGLAFLATALLRT
jgi:hypothetical protein